MGNKSIGGFKYRNTYTNIAAIRYVCNHNLSWCYCTCNRVAVTRSQDIPYFGPEIPDNAVFDKNQNFKEFILTKCMLLCTGVLYISASDIVYMHMAYMHVYVDVV